MILFQGSKMFEVIFIWFVPGIVCAFLGNEFCWLTQDGLLPKPIPHRCTQTSTHLPSSTHAMSAPYHTSTPTIHTSAHTILIPALNHLPQIISFACLWSLRFPQQRSLAHTGCQRCVHKLWDLDERVFLHFNLPSWSVLRNKAIADLGSA